MTVSKMSDHVPATTKTMCFSAALVLLKIGKFVQRQGWNGRGMFLYLVEGSTFVEHRPPLTEIVGDGVAVSYLPHIDMKTVDGTFVPWLCSQTDMLADDWVEVKVSPQQEELPIG